MAPRLIAVGPAKRRVDRAANVRGWTARSRQQGADFYRRRWSVETAYRNTP